MKLPRETDEEKAVRAAAIREAALAATLSPLRTVEASLEVVALAEELAGRSNKNASSDLEVAALMSVAACRSAAANVYINLPSLGDEHQARELFERTEGIADAVERLASRTREQVRGGEARDPLPADPHDDRSPTRAPASCAAGRSPPRSASRSPPTSRRSRTSSATPRPSRSSSWARTRRRAVYLHKILDGCRLVGIEDRLVELPADAGEADIAGALRELQADPHVAGIIVQMPLPKGIPLRAVIDVLDPLRDIDGIHPLNAGLLSLGYDGFLPATAHAASRSSSRAGIEISGKHAVVVGRSNVIGKPAALLLLRENATVTICHSKTADLADVIRTADIVVVAIGRANFVTGDMLKPGAVVVDVGINVVDGKLVGRRRLRDRQPRRLGDHARPGRRRPAHQRDPAHPPRAGRPGTRPRAWSPLGAHSLAVAMPEAQR